MTPRRLCGLVAAAFLFGIIVGLALAATPALTRAAFADKDPRMAADDVLAVAIGQAGDGTWERLAIARSLYLGGEKDRGQLLIDSVLKGKPEASDLRRALQIYGEAEEWDKALPIADQLVAMAPQDADDLAQAGAWCNVAGQREKAEALFTRALAKGSKDVWVTTMIGGSYLGVGPLPQ